MKIAKRLLLISLALSYFSCGHEDPSNRFNDQSMTVDWSSVNTKPVPKILDQAATTVGPLPLTKNVEITSTSKKGKVPTALILGPGGYRSLSHIALLKELRLQSEEPSVIVGHGLASVIAAYYAFGYEPDYIEWKFFKFINELNDEEIFGKDWLELVKKKLVNELIGKRVEEGRLTLIIPTWSESKQRVIFHKRGDLGVILMANLDHKGILNKDLRPAFTFRTIGEKEIKGLGVNRIIFVDLLTNGITWSRGSGFLNGIFEKAASVTLKSEAKADIMISYPLKEYRIDDLSQLADLVFKSKTIAKEKIQSLKSEKTNL